MPRRAARPGESVFWNKSGFDTARLSVNDWPEPGRLRGGSKFRAAASLRLTGLLLIARKERHCLLDSMVLAGLDGVGWTRWCWLASMVFSPLQFVPFSSRLRAAPRFRSTAAAGSPITRHERLSRRFWTRPMMLRPDRLRQPRGNAELSVWRPALGVAKTQGGSPRIAGTTRGPLHDLHERASHPPFGCGPRSQPASRGLEMPHTVIPWVVSTTSPTGALRITQNEQRCK
jgi:hypothetical protein